MSEEKSFTLSRKEFLKIGGSYILGMVLPEILHNYVPYVSHGDRDSNKIALTIDDGWSSEMVENGLNILENIPASLFIVGKCIVNKPDIYKKAINNGFEIHNHTWSHGYLNDPKINISNEITRWEEAYKTLGFGDYQHKVLRPPANEGVNDPILYSTLAKHGYKAVLGWSYGSPGVFKNYSKEDVVDFIIPKLQGGDIILMHFTQTDIEALPDIIQEAHNRKLEFVGLTKMPGIPIYTEDKKKHNISQ